MKKNRKLLQLLMGATLVMLTNVVFAAECPAKPAAKEPRPGGLGSLLGALGDIQIPSLAGLIQPEKMGMFSDNPIEVSDNETHMLSDNQTHVLSDNEADRDFLSGNLVNVLSNLRFFSDIQVTVKITVHAKDAKPAKPKKDGEAAARDKRPKDRLLSDRRPKDRPLTDKRPTDKRPTDRPSTDKPARPKSKP